MPKMTVDKLLELLYSDEVKSIILDTDAYNEVDDQFCISYCMRSPDRVRVLSFNAAPFLNANSTSPADGMEKSYNEIFKIMHLVDPRADIPVFRGSDAFLKDKNTPIPSPAAENIIQTVMGSDEPVLIFSIGAITNVASALLMCPELAERTAVVWLGGHALENPNTREFNMVQDVAAAQIVFDSGIPLLQIPCAGVCTQCHTTVYELEHYIDGKNELCTYLTDNVRKALTGWYGHLVKHANGTPVNHAVSGVIWDALAAATLIRPCACEIVKLPRPIITSDCLYAFDSARRPYLYTRGLNRDMIYGDIFDRLTRE